MPKQKKKDGKRVGIFVLFLLFVGFLVHSGGIQIPLLTVVEPTKTSCIAGGGQWTSGDEFYTLNTFANNNPTDEYNFEYGRHLDYDPVYIKIPKESYVSSAVIDVSGEKIVVTEDCLDYSCTAPDITTEDYNCNYQAVGIIGAGISSRAGNWFGTPICTGSSQLKVHTEFYTAVKGGSSCKVIIRNGCKWDERTCYGNPVSCEKGETISDVQRTQYGCEECSWSSFGGYKYNCVGCGSTSWKDPMLYMEWNYSSYTVNPTVRLHGTPIFNTDDMYTESTTVDITEELNNALEKCNPNGIYCNIPIDASVLSSGTLTFENLEIELADKECVCPSGTFWTGTACRPEDENYTEYMSPEEEMEILCVNTDGTWNGVCDCPDSYEVIDGYYIENSQCKPYRREIVYEWSDIRGCVKDIGKALYLPYSSNSECLAAVSEGITEDSYEEHNEETELVYDDETDEFVVDTEPPTGIRVYLENVVKVFRRFFS